MRDCIVGAGDESSALEFRPLTRADLPLLATWLAETHVQRFWRHDAAPAAVESDFGPGVDGTDHTRFFIVSEGSRPVGLIQSYRISDHPDWLAVLNAIGVYDAHVGIDYLIGEVDATGRGLGTRMLSRFVDLIWGDYPDAGGIVVAVQQDNPASWKVLEKTGFRRVWSGFLDSGDPSDSGPSYLYEINRSRR